MSLPKRLAELALDPSAREQRTEDVESADKGSADKGTDLLSRHSPARGKAGESASTKKLVEMFPGVPADILPKLRE